MFPTRRVPARARARTELPDESSGGSRPNDDPPLPLALLVLPRPRLDEAGLPELSADVPDRLRRESCGLRDLRVEGVALHLQRWTGLEDVEDEFPRLPAL